MSLLSARVSRGVRFFFSYSFSYCPCLVCHSVAVHYFLWVPKILSHKRFKSGGGISMLIFTDVILAALDRLLLLSFFLSVSGRLLPCAHKTAFPLNEKYRHSLVSLDLVARYLVTPLLLLYNFFMFITFVVLV